MPCTVTLVSGCITLFLVGEKGGQGQIKMTFQTHSRTPFCSTDLPLGRTRWVWSTFSSHCPLLSYQRWWLTSATLTIFPRKDFVKAENRTRSCWVRSKYATSLLSSPPPPSRSKSWLLKLWSTNHFWKLFLSDQTCCTLSILRLPRVKK